MGGEALQTRSRSDPYFGVGYPSVRQFVIEKLSQTLTDFDETWQESSFGQAGENDTSAFAFCHQGAELSSAKGEKMGVLAYIGDF